MHTLKRVKRNRLVIKISIFIALHVVWCYFYCLFLFDISLRWWIRTHARAHAQTLTTSCGLQCCHTRIPPRENNNISRELNWIELKWIDIMMLNLFYFQATYSNGFLNAICEIAFCKERNWCYSLSNNVLHAEVVSINISDVVTNVLPPPCLAHITPQSNSGKHMLAR